MPIQFDVDPAVAPLVAATTEFVREVVIPAERECGGSVHDAPEALRETLQKAAREAGVFAPHVPKRWGGHGLDLRGQAAVFEAALESASGVWAMRMAFDLGEHLLRTKHTAAAKRRLAGVAAADDGDLGDRAKLRLAEIAARDTPRHGRARAPATGHGTPGPSCGLAR